MGYICLFLYFFFICNHRLNPEIFIENNKQNMMCGLHFKHCFFVFFGGGGVKLFIKKNILLKVFSV